MQTPTLKSQSYYDKYAWSAVHVRKDIIKTRGSFENIFFDERIHTPFSSEEPTKRRGYIIGSIIIQLRHVLFCFSSSRQILPVKMRLYNNITIRVATLTVPITLVFASCLNYTYKRYKHNIG